MSPSLEDRLAGHLHSRADANAAIDASSTGLSGVRKLARRRTMRQRAGVGLCGLAALVGAATFVPGGDEPNALITAADPTSVEQEPTTEPNPDTPAVAQEDELEPTLTERETTAAPPPQRIIGDGQGGFVAISVSTITGRSEFVRSDDGKQWYPAGMVQLDDRRYFLDLQFVDGYFVAITDERRSAPPGGYTSPQVAVSKDLASWTFLDIERSVDESKSLAITDIALTDRDIMIQATELAWANPTDYDVGWIDVCGQSLIDGQWSIALCSGGYVPVDEDLSRATGPRFFTGSHRTDDVLLEIDGPATEGDVVLVGGDSLGWLQTFPENDTTTVAIETAMTGEQVTLLRSGDVVRAVVAQGTESTTSDFPEEVDLNPDLPVRAQLGHGPAGWAAILTNVGHGVLELENDAGWRLDGTPGLTGAAVASPNGDEFYFYDGRGFPLVSNTRSSLFGGLRFLRPGTTDILFELSGDVVRRSQASFAGTTRRLPPTAEFDGELVVDGWTLRGDPIQGPLTLVAPTGDERVFDDGFAFMNGDPTDGVEAELATSGRRITALSLPFGALQFFNPDGTQSVSFDLDDVLAELIPGDVDGRPAVTLPGPRPAWIVHSTNGTDWNVVKEIEFPEGRLLTLAIGEDEILMVEPSGVTRIDLDE